MSILSRFANLGRAVTVEGGFSLYTWGSNSDGQIGNNTSVSKFSPVQIGTLTDWASVDAGGSYSLAVKTGGTLWAWGLGTSGQLGDGSTVNKSSPVQIGALLTWKFDTDLGPTGITSGALSQ